MDNMRDPKPSRDRQIFKYIFVDVEGKLASPLRPMGIGKRNKESSRVSNNNVELVDKVMKPKSKVDDLQHVVGLIYEMSKRRSWLLELRNLKYQHA